MAYSEAELRQIIAKLRTFSTPELSDGMTEFRAMAYQIKPYIGRQICGPALTVDVPYGDGGLIPDAIMMLREGDVLVIAGKGNTVSSYWGDHRSICARMVHADGVVIDGLFRDVDECGKVGFPIFARGFTCSTAAKGGKGQIQVPVSCGGITVCPGDLVVGDKNGVLVIRQDEAEDVMKRALDKREAQQAVIDEMQRTGKVIPRIKLSK